MQTKSECPIQNTHSLFLDQRARARITGVEDVMCFNEELAVVTTTMGEMTLTGSGLKVAKLDLQAGEVALEGRVDSVSYGAARKKGIFARLTR